MDLFFGVKCNMVVKLGGRIGELVGLDFKFGGFGQCRWVMPPFGKVHASN